MEHKMTLTKFFGCFVAVFFIGPYIVLSELDVWQVRWIFGLIFFTVLPIMFLYVAITRIGIAWEDSHEKLPVAIRVRRRLLPFFCLGFIAAAIGLMWEVTLPYIQSSFVLASNGWAPDRVTGVIRESKSSPKAMVILRDIQLAESKTEYCLLYPLGKKYHAGQSCELWILPGTDIAVDLKDIASEQNVTKLMGR
jgi:hypothetical protein